MVDAAKQKQPSILAVDDVRSNLLVIKGFLEPQDYRVATARSAQEALDFLDRETPDLILLDAVMPGMDGFEMLRCLRQRDGLSHLPVIMVTALSDIADKVRGQEAGADDFLSKPFNRAELLLRVKSLLRIKALHDQLALKVEELEEAKRRLRDLADHDELTGLYNKRYFNRSIELECERATRYERGLGVVLMDIDHFKSINDTHGHPTGDHVLRHVAGVVGGQSRQIDTVARYGGEEFVHLVVEVDPHGASCVARKHRVAVADFDFDDEHGRPLDRITLSAGVATFPHDGTTPGELIKAADRRLYQAKQAGRNCVVSAETTLDPTLVR